MQMFAKKSTMKLKNVLKCQYFLAHLDVYHGTMIVGAQEMYKFEVSAFGDVFTEIKVSSYI